MSGQLTKEELSRALQPMEPNEMIREQFASHIITDLDVKSARPALLAAPPLRFFHPAEEILAACAEKGYVTFKDFKRGWLRGSPCAPRPCARPRLGLRLHHALDVRRIQNVVKHHHSEIWHALAEEGDDALTDDSAKPSEVTHTPLPSTCTAV